MDLRTERIAKWLAVIVACIVVTTVAPAQETPPTSRWFVSYRVAWTAFDMVDAKNQVHDLIRSYNAGGVPLRPLVMFPGNGAHGVEVFRTHGPLRYGAGVATTSTLAFTSYRDGAGSIRIRAAAEATLIHVHAGATVWQTEAGSVYAILEAGMVLGRLETDEVVTFIDFPTENVSHKLDRSSHGLFWKPAVGFESRIFDRFIVGIEAGYRVAQKQEIAMWTENNNSKSDFSGWSLSLTAGLSVSDLF